MKLNYIDSIRGVAILMVILGHIGQEVRGLSLIPHLLTSYGQMGVQLFFVASSYTLCLSARNRASESHPIKKYAIRRFFRIAPIYYIGLLGYFLVNVFLLWNKGGTIAIPDKYTFTNVIANLLFIHGFYPSANNNIVPGGWSIGTEMAFYVLFPILFYYDKKINLQLKNGLFLIFAVLAFSQLMLLLIFQFTGLLVNNNSFMYYNLINQLPVFCVGIGYYILEENKVFKTNWKFDLIAFVLLTHLSLLLWGFDWEHIFSVIPFISAISFIFLMNIFKKIKTLNCNLLVKIGTVSYSMYIIHFVLLPFSGFISTRLSSSINKNILLILLYLVTAFLTYILAIISEKYIEKPFIERGRKLTYIFNNKS